MVKKEAQALKLRMYYLIFFVIYITIIYNAPCCVLISNPPHQVGVGVFYLMRSTQLPITFSEIGEPYTFRTQSPTG